MWRIIKLLTIAGVVIAPVDNKARTIPPDPLLDSLKKMITEEGTQSDPMAMAGLIGTVSGPWVREPTAMPNVTLGLSQMFPSPGKQGASESNVGSRAQMAWATVIKDEPVDIHQHTQGEHPEAEMKQMKVEKEKESQGHSHEVSEQHEEKASGIYTCPMDSHSHVVQMGPGECPECGMTLVAAEETSGRTVFVCPMPEDSVVTAGEGRCPKCGMALVKKTKGIKKEGLPHEMSEGSADHEKEGENMHKEKASGIYTCPMDSHSHIVLMGPGECPECGMTLVPAEETSGRTVFVCPMPEDSVVTAEPGRCEKCGMKLVEKKIESAKK